MDGKFNEAADKYFQFPEEIEPCTPDWYRVEGVNFASVYISRLRDEYETRISNINETIGELDRKLVDKLVTIRDLEDKISALTEPKKIETSVFYQFFERPDNIMDWLSESSFSLNEVHITYDSFISRYVLFYPVEIKSKTK